MYMNDIKVFTKNEKALETLIQTIYSDRMKEWNLAFQKMCHAHIENGKRESAEGIELQNQKRFKTLSKKENCIY